MAVDVVLQTIVRPKRFGSVITGPSGTITYSSDIRIGEGLGPPIPAEILLRACSNGAVSSAISP